MGHSEIGVTMNVYGHLFEGAQAKLTNDLNGLVDSTRNNAGQRVTMVRRTPTTVRSLGIPFSAHLASPDTGPAGPD